MTLHASSMLSVESLPRLSVALKTAFCLFLFLTEISPSGGKQSCSFEHQGCIYNLQLYGEEKPLSSSPPACLASSTLLPGEGDAWRAPSDLRIQVGQRSDIQKRKRRRKGKGKGRKKDRKRKRKERKRKRALPRDDTDNAQSKPQKLKAVASPLLGARSHVNSVNTYAKKPQLVTLTQTQNALLVGDKNPRASGRLARDHELKQSQDSSSGALLTLKPAENDIGLTLTDTRSSSTNTNSSFVDISACRSVCALINPDVTLENTDSDNGTPALSRRERIKQEIDNSIGENPLDGVKFVSRGYQAWTEKLNLEFDKLRTEIRVKTTQLVDSRIKDEARVREINLMNAGWKNEILKVEQRDAMIRTNMQELEKTRRKYKRELEMTNLKYKRELQSTKNKYDKEIEEKNDLISKTTKDLTETRTKLSNTEFKLETSDKESEKLKKELADTEKKLATTQGARNLLDSQLKDTTRRLEVKTASDQACQLKTIRQETAMEQFKAESTQSNNKLQTELDDTKEKCTNDINDRDETIRVTTADLKDTRTKLAETETMLEESQQESEELSDALVETENELSDTRAARDDLSARLDDTTLRLEVSLAAHEACEAEGRVMRATLDEALKSEEKMAEQLITAQIQHNFTKEELSNLEAEHKRQSADYDDAVELLNTKEQELLYCYSSKTNTFCGFEDDRLCGFTQVNDTDFFDWERAQGTTPSGNTGPTGDHTCGNTGGHFMFIEASAKAQGNTAALSSPLYRGLSPHCVTFYYHMYGKKVGTLNVYAQAKGEEMKAVWRAYGNQGDVWSKARLNIPKVLAKAGYKIVFEGIAHGGFEGDISIDDISVTDGACAVEGEQKATEVKVSERTMKAGRDFGSKITREKKLAMIRKKNDPNRLRRLLKAAMAARKRPGDARR